jgi:chromosome segregation ATPase
MESVSKTPTATDANLERKKILEEVTQLIQQRDLLRMETQGWNEARNAVRGELEANTGLVLSTGEYDDRLSTELRKKRKSIQEEIDKLSQIREFRKNEVVSLERESINKKTEADSHKKTITALKNEIDRQSVELTRKKRESEEFVDKNDRETNGMILRLDNARTELTKINKEVKDKTTWIMTEEKRLGNKGRDLAIYENRIRKAAEKINLEIVI